MGQTKTEECFPLVRECLASGVGASVLVLRLGAGPMGVLSL